MAVDVDGARRVVARVLDDQVEVWRDSGGHADYTLTKPAPNWCHPDPKMP